MHWFSGRGRILKEALEMGCYFSINQQMLLSKNGRGIVDALPMDRILIESDAPFSKGMEERYSLLFEDKIYDYLSKEKAVSKREISQLIKNNFRKVIS
jgi:TatD DNase family protein